MITTEYLDVEKGEPPSLLMTEYTNVLTLEISLKLSNETMLCPLSIYSIESTYYYRDTCTSVFIITL